MRLSYCVLLLIVPLTVCFGETTSSKTPQSTEQTLFPPGMVAFFVGARCPEGWTSDPSAGGRVVIGAATEAESGSVSGEPFVENQVPKHKHAFSAGGELESRDMPTLYGCCFTRDWVLPQSVEIQDETVEQDLALPFFAVRACRQESSR